MLKALTCVIFIHKINTDTTLDLCSKEPTMLSGLSKVNKKAPKIELTFGQGPFRPKINFSWSLYFSYLFLLSANF